MSQVRKFSLLIAAALLPLCAHAETATEVVVKGERKAPDVPTTTEGVTAEALARAVNIVTPEDTLRYVPNVLIRQRHIGDTQSPITTRTSGVGGSARSLIYVDGILISALIGNNNTSASPKWGLITPDAVARVDVLYGPYSAAYAGNSLGSVILFQTRMPTKLEGGIDVQAAVQDFKKYGDKASYATGRIAADIGDRKGRLAWRLSLNHLDTHSQPLTYITTTGAAPAGSTGGFDALNRTGAAIKVLGAGGLEHQVQDNASGRVTYDLTPTLTAAYMFGLFLNDDQAHANTYLKDASGAPVYTPAFSNGVYRLKETQLAQGLSLTSHTGGVFDYSLTMSVFNYLKGHQRTPTASLPAAWDGGAGTDAVLNGTGWNTLDAQGVWRPAGPHQVSFGLHQDSFRLDNPKYKVADWRGDDDGALISASRGQTRTQAIWAQDMMTLGPRTRLTAGLRLERWRAFDGENYSASPALAVQQPELKRDAVSPKLVLAFNPQPDWTLKASVGAASRFPTVTELYQAVTTGAVLSVPNPALRPEQAVSSELSAQKIWPDASLRVSVFHEEIKDALLSQSAPLVAGSSTLYNYVQNIDRTRGSGVELVGDKSDFLIRNLQISGWLTYAEVRIDKDTAFAAAVGKDIPQLPRLRGALVLTWEPTPKWDITVAARYSDPSYGTIDNSDHVHDAYTGFDGFTVIDLHARYRLNARWSADLGVNNLNNQAFFLYHPFPQRTAILDLKYRL
ncbi:MAG TPA: TonB-dependent receptor [Asticcacaulis sp.]|nr:TonB-dependent receptor [Asticcacaulis sp.]